MTGRSAIMMNIIRVLILFFTLSSLANAAERWQEKTIELYIINNPPTWQESIVNLYVADQQPTWQETTRALYIANQNLAWQEYYKTAQ